MTLPVNIEIVKKYRVQIIVSLVVLILLYRFRHILLTQMLPNQFGIRHKALETALSQEGVKETTNNGGPQVDQYLASVGLGTGYAWCMAFVYWSYQQAAKNTGITNPLTKTGGVLNQWNNTPPQYKKKTPSVGSIFIMDLGKGNGHTGIVTKVNADGTINTIEGNTNAAGSANGNAVLRRKRVVGSPIVGFITI